MSVQLETRGYVSTGKIWDSDYMYIKFVSLIHTLSHVKAISLSIFY